MKVRFNCSPLYQILYRYGKMIEVSILTNKNSVLMPWATILFPRSQIFKRSVLFKDPVLRDADSSYNENCHYDYWV